MSSVPVPRAGSPRPRTETVVGVSLLALLVVVCLLRRAPWAAVDDIAFVGTAIELVRTGQPTNSVIDGWLSGFGTHLFYIHVPLYVYLMAGWIWLFGVSSAGLATMHWFIYGLGMFGVIRLARRLGLSLAAGCLLAGLYLVLVLPMGMRPDPPAFALMFLGLSLLETRSPWWQRFAALCLLGLSVLTYPMPLGIAVPFGAALLWRQRTRQATWQASVGVELRAWSPVTVLAVAATFLALLAMVHGDLRGFLRVLAAHHDNRLTYNAGGLGAELISLLTMNRETVLKLPVVLLLFAAIGYVLVRWPQIEEDVRLLVCACLCAATVCVFLYVDRAIEWVVWLGFCAALTLARARAFQRREGWVLPSLLALAVWSQAMWFVHLGLRRFTPPEQLRSVRAAALGSGKKLVVDAVTARYVFDFQLPPGTRDLVYFKPWRGGLQRLEDKPADTWWIVTPRIMAMVIDDLPPEADDYPRVMLGHHAFRSLPLREDEPLVIR